MQVWEPSNILNCPASYKYAVVILDRPICLPTSILMPLWEKAQVTVTVDGGTDRWMEYLGDRLNNMLDGKCSLYVPTLITGDMDSISTGTTEKLQSIGSKVITTPNQNLTDYSKALMELAQHCKSQKIKLNGIYVIVNTSGRFDHIIGNINTLHKAPEFFDETQVIQVASDSLTWLLKPGKHRIIIPEALVRAQCWCGLLPFCGKVDKMSTTGLKWNLDNFSMEFGGLVSTSNTYENECKEVTIDLVDRIIWTMGIEPLVAHYNISDNIFYAKPVFYTRIAFNNKVPPFKNKTRTLQREHINSVNFESEEFLSKTILFNRDFTKINQSPLSLEDHKRS